MTDLYELIQLQSGEENAMAREAQNYVSPDPPEILNAFEQELKIEQAMKELIRVCKNTMTFLFELPADQRTREAMTIELELEKTVDKLEALMKPDEMPF